MSQPLVGTMLQTIPCLYNSQTKSVCKDDVDMGGTISNGNKKVYQSIAIYVSSPLSDSRKQTLGGAQEILQKRRRKDFRNHRVPGHHKNNHRINYPWLIGVYRD